MSYSAVISLSVSQTHETPSLQVQCQWSQETQCQGEPPLRVPMNLWPNWGTAVLSSVPCPARPDLIIVSPAPDVTFRDCI